VRAWTVSRYGHYKQELTLSEVETPRPEGPTTLIQVEAAGVMFADILNINGSYQIKAPLPFTPGCEAAGTVREAGAGSKFKEGDRVVALNLVGAFAETMFALDEFTFLLPEGMTFAEAAAFTINYQTAWFAIHVRGRLAGGETLLVHGGAGGVGTAAIQLGKHLGATVIATAGSDEKLQVCKDCGADHVINYRTEDFVPRVKEIADGAGAGLIFDPVGGEIFEKSIKCAGFEGRIVSVGFASGVWPTAHVNRVMVKNIDIIGLNWGNYQLHKPEAIQAAQAVLYDIYNQGAIKPVIYKQYPMAGLPEALEAIESRKSFGKVILEPQH